MKKSVKIFAIILLVMIAISFSTNVLAAKGTILTPDQVEAQVDYSGTADSSFLVKVGKVIGTIRNVAVIVSVLVLVILGIKYMLGSVEEKAEYKKAFMPLIIGIILVVASSSIASFIFTTIG